MTAPGVMAARRRYSQLAAVIGTVTRRGLPKVSRKAEYVWMRTMVAYRMKTEGYTLRQIAAAMEKATSTVVYMWHKMEHVMQYPRMYRDITPTWNKFLKGVERWY